MLKDRAFLASSLSILGLSLLVAACGGKSNRPAATTSGPPPPVSQPTRPATTQPVDTGVNTMEDEGRDDSLLSLDDPLDISGRTIEELNADPNRGFLEDVHFDFDSAVLSDQARATLERHATFLNDTYPNMTLLVEGHCDERGTVEYNLALGERRANAIVSYLVSLGVGASRLRAISYGKEFPLDPGHDEAAWARNRRGHFELTGK